MSRFALPRLAAPLIVLTPCALLIAACGDDEPIRVETEPPDVAAVMVQTDLRSDRGTIDDRWAAISQTEVPGFAGFWYDPLAEEIVVAATDPESREAAIAYAERSAIRRDFPTSPIRFKPVDYDFLELRTWKTSARPLLRRSDVAYVDADEVRNRIVVGVTSGAAMSQIDEELRGFGVMGEGVDFAMSERGGFNSGSVVSLDESPPARAPASSTLRDKVRPTVGGLEIDPNLRGACTLGINTLVGGEGSDLFFATASHCSDTQWGDDTGWYEQDSGGSRIGRESHDLAPQTGSLSFNGQTYNCTSTPCRFSDVSLVAYDDTIASGDVDLGKIAFAYENSITIIGEQLVTAERELADLYSGLRIEMVGKESGRTKGDITATCIDWAADGGVTFDLLCQYRGDYDATFGDSGAPIYALRPNATVALLGIHSASPNDSSQFSTIAGVEEDLSVTLDFCIPSGCTASAPALDVDIDGPSSVLEWVDCTYTADVTGGWGSYSYRWFIDDDSVTVDGDQEMLSIDDVGDDDFLLEVRVIDELNTGKWGRLTVDVSPSHTGC